MLFLKGCVGSVNTSENMNKKGTKFKKSHIRDLMRDLFKGFSFRFSMYIHENYDPVDSAEDVLPATICPSAEYDNSINFPNRLELLFITVLAFPNASNKRFTWAKSEK